MLAIWAANEATVGVEGEDGEDFVAVTARTCVGNHVKSGMC